MSLRFQVTTIQLPTRGHYVGTWGSALVAHPQEPIVVLSLPRGAGPLPWATVDVATGTVRLGRGLHGELRDGLVAGDEALCLTTHAICRLRLFPEPEVIGTYRPRGLGKYLWRLLDFGPDHVAATGWSSKSVLVLRRTDGSVVRRIAATAPQSSIRINDHVIRLFALHGGEVVDVDLRTMKVIERHRVPDGTRAVVADDEVYALLGTRRAAHSHVDTRQIWRIEPNELAALNGSLKVARRVPAPSGAREVIAIMDGVLVIATDRGLALARTSDLRELGALHIAGRDVWQHAFVPGTRSAVVSPDRFLPTQLKVIRWT